MQARAGEPGLEPVVVGAVRTPVGRRNGGLAGVHAVDLGAVVLRALVERSGIDPMLVDDVIMGCVSQIGEQSLNVARNAWLAAGLPEEVPATTIDRQCGSSQQAVQFAAQGIMAGGYQLVVAGGVEHMTRVPMGSTMERPGRALRPGHARPLPGPPRPPGHLGRADHREVGPGPRGAGRVRPPLPPAGRRRPGRRPLRPAARPGRGARARTAPRPGCGWTRECGGTPPWRSWPG